MSTETRGPRGERGFTLIEVLIAMVLLGIALMAVVPLGVIATRQVGLGERNSRSAATATLFLEDALQIIRRDSLPRGCAITRPNGDQVTRQVIRSSPSVAEVRVTVTPERRGMTLRSYTIRSYGFSPTLAADTSGRPCP